MTATAHPSIGTVLFRANFRPDAGTIASLRDFVQQLAAGVLGDRELSERIGLAVHELLENCAKYSSDGRAVIRVDVGEERDESIVAVTVRNRAPSAHAAVLRRAIDEVESAIDPFTHYVDALRRSVARSSGSGLGLARISAEAGMRLRGSVVGEEVSVVAEARRGMK